MVRTSSKRRHFALLQLPAALLLCVAPVHAQSDIESVVTNDRFQSAIDYLADDHARFVDELIRITEVPAPPFNERERANLFAELLRDSGLSNVEIDAEGNVIGLREGVEGSGTVAVLAHLDTVFPANTDVRVRRDGSRLYAPGIGDDSRGLAVILALVRAVDCLDRTAASASRPPIRRMRFHAHR